MNQRWAGDFSIQWTIRIWFMVNCEFINIQVSSFIVIPKHRLYVFDWVFPSISIFVGVNQFKITYFTFRNTSRMRFDLVPLCSNSTISLLQAFIYTTRIRFNHFITKLSPIEICGLRNFPFPLNLHFHLKSSPKIANCYHFSGVPLHVFCALFRPHRFENVCIVIIKS